MARGIGSKVGGFFQGMQSVPSSHSNFLRNPRCPRCNRIHLGNCAQDRNYFAYGKTGHMKKDFLTLQSNEGGHGKQKANCRDSFAYWTTIQLYAYNQRSSTGNNPINGTATSSPGEGIYIKSIGCEGFECSGGRYGLFSGTYCFSFI